MSDSSIDESIEKIDRNGDPLNYKYDEPPAAENDAVESSAEEEEESLPRVAPKKLNPNRPAKVGYGYVEDMPAQHIRLFSPWIFDPVLPIFELYKDILTADEVERLQHALAEQDDYDKLRNFFYAVTHILGTDERAQKFMNKFLQASPRAVDIQHKIYFTHPDCIPESFFVYWDHFIDKFHDPKCENILDRICFAMKIQPILEYLKTSPEYAYRNVYEMLKIYADGRTYNNLSEFQRFILEWRARCSILIELITSKPKKQKPEHWYLEFLKACNTSPETRAIAFVLEREFRGLLDEYDIEVKKLAKPATTKSAADFVDPDEAPRDPRPQKLYGDYPPEITGQYTSNYDLRKYQQELTIKAKEGLNTIICAPTGSGKTHVAADIILHHLRRIRHSERVGRVVMFVPTIPLVNQQAAHLSTNLRPEFYVEKLSGAEKSDKGDVRKAATLLRADVIVLTPQIFINMLLSPLKSQKIYVTDFTLFVFDECHHCNELHPYNVLMNIVRESVYKPQVVGLTASVGDGSDAKSRMDPESAMQHMISLCARLNADTVTSIRDPENMLEMHYHISKPLDEIYPCRPSAVDDFAHQIALISDHIQNDIQDVLQKAVKEIYDFSEDLIKLPLEGSDGKNGSRKTSYRYNGKLGILKHNIDKRDLDRDRRHFLLKCFELLEICHFTLRNNELMPAKYAFQYLQERIRDAEKFGAYEQHEKNPSTTIGKYMQRLRGLINYVKGKYEYLDGVVPASNRKPIYNELLNHIQNQYLADKTSRIIIFVESRKGCVKMAECLKEEYDAIGRTFGQKAVEHIVSVNQSIAHYGQSSNEQDRILKGFKHGSINILVATSVAEEGLDVAQCNLIIKYNSVGSEKSYIQRKGRARAKNSRSVLLAITSSVEQQEYTNIMREYLMNICLENLQNMSERELKERINVKKQEIIAELEQKRRMEERRKSISALYKLECVICGIEICHSNEVACLMESQFVCCKPCVWEKTKIKQRFEKNFNQRVTSLCGEWMCQCGKKRGEVIKYGEAYLPTLAADGFRLSKKTATGYVPVEDKKLTWKVLRDNFFAVGAITTDQIRSMINALLENNAEAFGDAQTNEELGHLEAVKNLEYQKKEKHALKESC